MAKKFYAVKEGRVPGIYYTWDECKKQVTGYSGAVYKGFETKEEAMGFIGIGQKKKHEEKCEVTAYTDGSYNVKTKRFSLGAVLFHNGETLTYSEAFSDEEMASMRNVAGELKAALYAMEYCIQNHASSLEICYDYEGVEKWCTGEWKANKEWTVNYREYYNSIKDKLNITFTKIKGHSGNKYNDMADKLAKEALGIE